MERPLDGALGALYRKPTNTGNVIQDKLNELGNVFRHEQLVDLETGENAGFYGKGRFFGDGEIRNENPENMKKYATIDATVYPSVEIETEIKKAQQEQEYTRDKFFEYRSGDESLASTNHAYDEPYFYNVLTNNCKDFACNIINSAKKNKKKQ